MWEKVLQGELPVHNLGSYFLVLLFATGAILASGTIGAHVKRSLRDEPGGRRVTGPKQTELAEPHEEPPTQVASVEPAKEEPARPKRQKRRAHLSRTESKTRRQRRRARTG